MSILSLLALAVALRGPVDLSVPINRQQTYCNPINIDYGYTPIPNFSTQGRHRATADPVIVLFRGDYYLFSTNQWGYWWSSDMVDWHFVPRHFLRPEHKVYDDLCAPAVWVMNDHLYVIGSTYADNFPIWVSDNPKVDDWHEAVHEFKPGGWDPAWFVDDDGKLYEYHGSSNIYPIYGQQIDPKSFAPVGPHVELIRLHDEEHGWERFGEANDNTFLRPFMEGAWMTKHHGRYYLQYGAPGTEFSGYGDGVYVSDHPLGPFEYQPHNPFSFKPGGFARGAGHGATFQDRNGLYWHISTITIAVKNSFERRLGIWPAGFDGDGIMHTEAAFGDYPTYLPHRAPSDSYSAGGFTGWMLLNLNKPITVSSTLGGYSPNNAVDESIRTYWSAKTGNPGEWIQSDLGAVSTIRAIQVNFADQDAEFLGKRTDIYHQYKLLGSIDGRHWQTLADKSHNRTDVPHDYVELSKAVELRFVRIENIHMPTGKFAISGLRVFGLGHGVKPQAVAEFVPLRADRIPGPEYNGAMADRRNAWLKWKHSDDASGYIIRSGIAPDKLYTSLMVYGANEAYVRWLDKSRSYYFQIQAFNENGLSEPTKPVKSD
jgi:hypothetical protein